jgi:UDPglucose 6-dehydrogenase
MEVCIIGAGVVGTCVGKGLLHLHHNVRFYDISTTRVAELQSEGLTAFSTLHVALAGSEISMICVPTPTVSGKIDLHYLQSAATEIAKCLTDKNNYHLVVVKSTVVPTTTKKIVIPILEHYSKRKIGDQLGVCVNPEFLTEINQSWTSDPSFARGFSNEPAIVIGESDGHAGETLAKLYEPLHRPVIRTTLSTAELVKYAFNCALATRISYWNEIHYVCKLLNIDSEIVAKVAGMDPRVGTYGTIHGKAFGGKCLPKDLRAFVEWISELGYEPKLLEAVEEINERIAKENGIRE